MSRVRFVEHQGKRILIEDFSHLSFGPEFSDTLKTAEKTIRAQPPDSVLAVFDATGVRFNNDMINAVKAFVKGNSPYIKASAVVGVEGLLNVALIGISKFSGRSFKSCNDRSAAMEWLVQQ